MKKKLLWGMMLLLLSLGACKKEEKTQSINENNSGNAGIAGMSAQINGQNWKATGISATLLVNAQTGRRSLSINGYSGDELILPAFEEKGNSEVLTTGSYDFNANNKYSKFAYAVLLPNGYKQAEHLPVSGVFTVTAINAIDKKISGTFSFQAVKAGTTDTLNVTNGIFTDVVYTVSKQ